ncbi:unnamed protein product [Caenorhabditis bovis]|uniref:Galectin n=1 Tax=Caenorhabditis bovis TaxID=2654633 RepID=A0A8S1EQJ0_9PELO|nr:unnamed protein product [Caenorhabditis bovis]
MIFASPFRAGENVEIRVKRIGKIYEITVNDIFFARFPHRFSDSENPTAYTTEGEWTVSTLQMICANRFWDNY